MTISLKSLFCCVSEPQTAPEPRSTISSKDSCVPQKSTRPNEEAPSKQTVNIRQHSLRSNMPPKNLRNRSEPHTPVSQEQIPLDYVSHGRPQPEEIALKGRRHSSLKPSDELAKGRPLSNHIGQVSGVEAGSSTDRHILSETENTADPTDKSPHPESGEIVARPHDSSSESGSPDGEAQDGLLTEDLLPPVAPEFKGRKCLVLDLDETLVHSSFKHIWNADFIIPVEIEGNVHDVYVVKRPGVDEFLERVSQLYEVVVFTASVAKYGDPLLDQLDPYRHVHHRLYRESCLNFQGNYIKNLSWIGRPLESLVIVDNSPAAYALQPNNAVPISSWFSDIHDNELLDMLPFLEDLAGQAVPNVLNVLGHNW